MKKRAEITVHGLVQGVGFRWFVEKQAATMGLKGYVANSPDRNKVETVVEGEESIINKFAEVLKKGISSSRIDNVLISWSEFKNEFKNFDIRFM